VERVGEKGELTKKSAACRSKSQRISHVRWGQACCPLSCKRVERTATRLKGLRRGMSRNLVRARGSKKRRKVWLNLTDGAWRTSCAEILQSPEESRSREQNDQKRTKVIKTIKEGKTWVPPPGSLTLSGALNKY